MNRGLRPAAWALALGLAGCSLPLPRGVQSATGVPAEQRPQDDITVIPPGPRPGQLPDQVVTGFLNAQSSPAGRHAVARRFLDRVGRWDDGGDVLVYDPASLEVKPLHEDGGTAEVRTTLTAVATLRRDGSAASLPPTSVTDTYRLVRTSGGDWRLAGAPAGLRLTAADRDRSFSAARTWFLAPVVSGESRHVVPDAVFLPDRPDAGSTVEALVRRLVAGPSQALAGSVDTAVPTGSRVERAGIDSSGLVRVDLSGPARMSPSQGAELSAQLVWTLRDVPTFTALRLRVGGVAVSLPPGASSDQGPDDYDGYDPDGLGATPRIYDVQDARLRVVDAPAEPGSGATGRPWTAAVTGVLEVAVNTSQTSIALVVPTGVRIGPLRGTTDRRIRAAGLHSPSYGSGGSGLWVLQGSHRLLRVLESGALLEVPVAGAPSGLTSLAVSRDGVRVALVAGGRLLVGRVDRSGSTPQVVGLVEIAPTLSKVRDVAWAGPASLAVVGTLQDTVLPVRVAVDGSTVAPLDGPGLPGRPMSIAASPVGTIVEALNAQGTSQLFRATSSGFVALAGSGRAPAYPG